MEVSTRETRIGEILSFVFDDKAEFEKKVKTLQFVQENLRESDVEGFVVMKHIIAALLNSYSQDERFHNGKPSTMIPMKEIEEFASAFFAMDGFVALCKEEMESAQSVADEQDNRIAELQSEITQLKGQTEQIENLKTKIADMTKQQEEATEVLKKYQSPAVDAVLGGASSGFRVSTN